MGLTKGFAVAEMNVEEASLENGEWFIILRIVESKSP